jgi:hypothetical protein
MRDLQDIAEINGPRRAELQAKRATEALINSVVSETIRPASILRAEHGARVEARQREKAGL